MTYLDAISVFDHIRQNTVDPAVKHRWLLDIEKELFGIDEQRAITEPVALPETPSVYIYTLIYSYALYEGAVNEYEQIKELSVKEKSAAKSIFRRKSRPKKMRFKG